MIILRNTKRNQYKETIESSFLTNQEATIELQLDEDLSNFIRKLRSEYSHNDLVDLESFHKAIQEIVAFFQNDPTTLTKFFAIIIKCIGFESDIQFDKWVKTVKKFQIDKSIPLLLVLLTELKQQDLSLKIELIKDMSCETYLQDVIRNVIKTLPTPSKDFYEILQVVLGMDPNLIENILEDIIVFTMLNHKDELGYYTGFLIELFKLFARLNREPKLVSIILKTVSKQILLTCSDEDSISLIDHINIQDLIPEEVKFYIEDLISKLSTKKSMTIFRTLTFQFKNDVISNIPRYANDKRFALLVEMETIMLLSYFLSNTITDNTKIETQFLKELMDFKMELKNFGQELLKHEHNSDLMFSFLSICQVWAELFIFLNHFKSNNDENKISSGENNLHNYLSADQWNTIQQRIANFGKIRCKQQMEKIATQGERLAQLEDNKQNTKNTLHIIVENLNIHLNSSNLSTTSIAQQIISTAITESNFSIFDSEFVQENRLLVESIIEESFQKINQELKPFQNIQSTNLIKNLKLIEKELENSKISKIFDDNSEMVNGNPETANTIINIMKILNHLPISYCSEKIRIEILLLSLCIHNDFKDNQIWDITELITENIVYTNFPKKLFNVISLNKLIKLLLPYKKIQIILKRLIEVTLQSDTLELKKLVKLLKNFNEAEQIMIVSTLFPILSLKKHKFSKESQTIVVNITGKLAKFVAEHFNEKSINSNLYALALDRCLKSDQNELLQNLIQYFDRVFEYCISESQDVDIKDKTMFLNILLKNKVKLDKMEKIPTDLIEKCSIIELVVDKNSNLNLPSLLSHAKLEELQKLLDGLVSKSIMDLSESNTDNLSSMKNIWEKINSMKFNAERSLVRQNAILTILNAFLFNMSLNQTNPKNIVFILESITIILKSQVSLTPSIIDTILKILCEVKLYLGSTENIEDFKIIFLANISILEVMLTFRSVLFISRLPAVLISYQILLEHLAYRSRIEIGDENEIATSVCAHSFLRITESLVKHQKDMARLAPYLIANMLQCYENVRIFPSVKTYFNRCLYGLLDICDSHAKSFLLRNLSVASKEIFKVTVDDFNKFYKFTGRS